MIISLDKNLFHIRNEKSESNEESADVDLLSGFSFSSPKESILQQLKPEIKSLSTSANSSDDRFFTIEISSNILNPLDNDIEKY